MTNLWEAYSKTKSASIREELILKYTYIVKYVAGRLYSSYGNNVEFDDLLSYGIFGLIDAIDKYDISRGVKFETYAQLRIRGAIIDQLREIDWLPRSVRQKTKALEKAYYEIENMTFAHKQSIFNSVLTYAHVGGERILCLDL